jgi:hypothetical protein
MELLKQVTKGRQPKPRRMLVYGTHGIGKSSYGACAPGAIFIQTEDGLGEIDCARFPLATDLGQVFQALDELHDEEHDYITAVLDSADWLERLIWERVVRDRGVKSIEDIGYGKGYVFATTYWRQVLEKLDRLRNDRGMMIILLAHSKIEKFEDPGGESYDRYSPRLHKHAASIVQEWCDEVLFANYDVKVKKTDEGFGQTRAIGVGGKRVLYTTERPSHLAKNRLGLPDSIEFTWGHFREAMEQALGAEESA